MAWIQPPLAKGGTPNRLAAVGTRIPDTRSIFTQVYATRRDAELLYSDSPDYQTRTEMFNTSVSGRVMKVPERSDNLR